MPEGGEPDGQPRIAEGYAVELLDGSPTLSLFIAQDVPAERAAALIDDLAIRLGREGFPTRPLRGVAPQA